jgi:hypothetical protein
VVVVAVVVVEVVVVEVVVVEVALAVVLAEVPSGEMEVALAVGEGRRVLLECLGAGGDRP